LPLRRSVTTFACAAGHSFDIARSGYVNLLQPQDRRSKQAGDSRTAVEARAALDRSGAGRALTSAIVERISALPLPPDPVVVDLGSGPGTLLGALHADRKICGIGIDLSPAAAGLAARHFAALTWVVANADRRLPLQDGSVDVVLSVHGRRNPLECARVLTANGVLLVALPAPDDLVELRTLVQGKAVERDRVDTMLREHGAWFALAERMRVRERLTLEQKDLQNLLRSTYRGARFKVSGRVESIQEMDVTVSAELCVLKKERSG
jgi:23S rRNA (guanine745-N1)-methyltransferase